MRISVFQAGTAFACTLPGNGRGGSGGSGGGRSAGRGGTGGGRYLPPGAAATPLADRLFCAGKESVLILKDKKALFPKEFPHPVPAAAVFAGGGGSRFSVFDDLGARRRPFSTAAGGGRHKNFS